MSHVGLQPLSGGSSLAPNPSAGNRLKNYGFSSEQTIKSAFQMAIESGEIVPSAYILHYLTPNAA